MNLTEHQRQHLFDLLIAADRPRPDSDTLVKKGLAERGVGKFGEWVRITRKGVDLAMSWPAGERIARESRWMNARVSQDSARMVDRGGRATSTVSPRSEKTGNQSMPAPATPLPSVPLCDVPPAPLSQEPAPKTTLVCNHRKIMSEHGDGTASVVPNSRRPSVRPRSPCRVMAVDAIRITHGSKVTYYPISMSASLSNGQRCKTSNPFYRSFPVAASKEDQDIL